MDGKSEKPGWNIEAQSFKPRSVVGNYLDPSLKQPESDNYSPNASFTQSMKVSDNGHANPYMTDFTNHLNNMTISPQYVPQFMLMPSIPYGLTANSFQSSPFVNRLSSANKPVVLGTHPANTYFNSFAPYTRMNNSSIIQMPYMTQPSVPNLTNAAGRSKRHIPLTNRVFNTGDIQIDQRLTESFKMINPRSDFDRDMSHSKFFVIKSYTEEHVHRSIKYGEWCSTQRGNDILDKAYRFVKSQNGHIYLFFSVNSSGYFCGVAEMTTEFDSCRRSAHWNDDKWLGGFQVQWLYVKDVPNKYLKHIILEHNDNRPITNSRDATEIKPAQKGLETLRLIHEYHHNSSIFDDFDFYESREREAVTNAPMANSAQ